MVKFRAEISMHLRDLLAGGISALARALGDDGFSAKQMIVSRAEEAATRLDMSAEAIRRSCADFRKRSGLETPPEKKSIGEKVEPKKRRW